MDSPEPYPEERMEEWKWDGKGFVLAHATSTGMCRLIAPGGAWDLPTRVGLGGGSEGEAFFGLVLWGGGKIPEVAGIHRLSVDSDRDFLRS